MKVTDLMSKKFISIDINDSVRNALALMKKKKISRLLVRKNKQIVGIVTERDLAERLGSEKERKLSDAHIHISSCYSDQLVKVEKDEDVKKIAELMIEKKISSILITEKDNIIGMVTKTDLIKILESSDEPIEKVMSKDVRRLDLGSRILEARRMMLNYKIKRLPITDKNNLVGIITESDIASALGTFRKVSEGKHWEEKMRNILVDDAMSSPVITLNPSDSIGKCVQIMLKKKISGIPILEGEEIKGIVTKTDLVKYICYSSRI